MLGDLRAADRVRARGRDRAAHRRCARAPVDRLGRRTQHAGRPARARPSRRHLARAAAVLRPRGHARAVTLRGRRARSHAGASTCTAPRHERRLAAPAGDPRHRLVDGRDARPERSGPPRPAAGGRPRAAQVRGPDALSGGDPRAQSLPSRRCGSSSRPTRSGRASPRCTPSGSEGREEPGPRRRAVASQALWS